VQDRGPVQAYSWCTRLRFARFLGPTRITDVLDDLFPK